MFILITMGCFCRLQVTSKPFFPLGTLEKSFHFQKYTLQQNLFKSNLHSPQNLCTRLKIFDTTTAQYTTYFLPMHSTEKGLTSTKMFLLVGVKLAKFYQYVKLYWAILFLPNSISWGSDVSDISDFINDWFSKELM